MFIFNKESPVAVLYAEYGGNEGPHGLHEGDPRLEPLRSLVSGGAGRLDEFDHRHLLAVFEQADQAAEIARQLQIALLSTDPPTQPVFMALHAGKKEIPGKPPAKGGLGEVVKSIVGLADEQALLMSDAAWKALSEPVQGHATNSLKPVPQGAGGQLYEMAWVEPTHAERTKMVTMMWDKQEVTAHLHLLLTYREQQIQVNVSRPAIIIGRSSQCDLVVNHKRASRLHARVEYRDGNFVLVDQSGNGTFVRFSDGDKVKVHMNSVPIRGAGDIGLGDAEDALSDDALRFVCVE